MPHDGQVLKLVPQFEELPQDLRQGAPQLEGCARTAGGTPEEMGQNGGEEDHRGQQPGDRLLPTGGLDDYIRAPRRFDAPLPVEPHDDQAHQRQQEDAPKHIVSEYVRHRQEPGEKAADDPNHHAHTQGKEDGPGGDAQALCTEDHLRIDLPKEAFGFVLPFL